MDFKKAGILGSFIAKDYSADLFRLLMTYSDISASEAASRLNLHIKTVQDFMEAMTSIGILNKAEAYESKRPYFRYSLISRKINLELDLNELLAGKPQKAEDDLLIREKQNARVRFNMSRNNQYISNLTIWMGEGRSRKERKLNLSIPQGKFLYHLPFPTANPLPVREIMKIAGVENRHEGEVHDIVNELIRYDVIQPAKKDNV